MDQPLLDPSESTSSTARRKSARDGRVHPYWCVAVAVLLTALAIFGFRRVVNERDESRFRNATEAVQDSLRARLDAYLSILQSTRSLFASQRGNVDLPTFRRFVGGLDLEHHYPGIQGIGFTERMTRDQVDSAVAKIEAQGQEPFRVWPDTPRDEYHAIVFIEPLDRRNRAALGYDMYSEPVRQEAMARARDTGMPAATGMLTLVQEIDPQKQPGFLIYVPVYQGGAAPPDVASRRKELLGFVYGAFRDDDLVRGIFGSEHAPRTAFDLYDGTEVTASKLMYQGIDASSPRPLHASTALLDVAGRPWTLRVISTEAFDSLSGSGVVPYLVGLGLLLNGVFFLATRAQVRAQQEELAAHRRLEILAATSKRLSEAQLDITAILETACREVAQRLTEACSLALIDAEGTHLEYVQTAHVDREAEAMIRPIFARTPIALGDGVVGRVAATGEPALVAVASNEALIAGLSDADHIAFLRRFPVSTYVVVALRLGERVIGIMACWRGPGARPFKPIDEQLLQEVADRTAFAVENARLAERLRLAVKLRDDFLSVAGHELKTPLAALQLQVENVLRQTQTGAMGTVSPRLVERLNKVRTLVVRLEILISGLLDVSRIAAGKLLFQREDVELKGLVADVVERFGDHVGRAGSEVSMEGSGLVVGQWDRVRLDQVFTNLVGNALKYGGGKPIEIRITRHCDSARVVVQDHGIGIAPEDRARIFDRFERAVPERNYAGLGLGLWISQQIVHAFGGRIELESEVGVGSTFLVELPLRPGDALEPA